MAELTAAQRLEVLKLARRLLGPKGKYWIKNNWRKTKEIDGKKVKCYCLEGAIDEAMCRLDLKRKPADNAGAANKSSIVKFLRRRDRKNGNKLKELIFAHYYGTDFYKNKRLSINVFNDAHTTSWDDIEKLIQDYTKELKAEVAAEGSS